MSNEGGNQLNLPLSNYGQSNAQHPLQGVAAVMMSPHASIVLKNASNSIGVTGIMGGGVPGGGGGWPRQQPKQQQHGAAAGASSPSNGVTVRPRSLVYLCSCETDFPFSVRVLYHARVSEVSAERDAAGLLL